MTNTVEEKFDEMLMGNKFIRREGTWSIRRQKGNRK